MSKHRPYSTVRSEAQFFVDLVCSGKLSIDQAREDIGISERTLTIWREWLEWETWPRAMFTASIQLRRRISYKFEELLAERVRQTCQELSEAAEAVEPEQQAAEVETIGVTNDAVHNL